MKLHNKCVKEKGKHSCGRNIVRDGHGKDYSEPTETQTVNGIRRLERALAPPPAPTYHQQTNYSAPPTSTSTGGAGGLPTCASESGTNYSMGPDNTNPSGASGRYQIMPFHWSSDCAGVPQTPSGQDKCASIIYANSGSGAWVGCGG